MILPDVNVLLYAFRRDAEHHEGYRAWLESVVNSGDDFGISPQVLASCVRISTHPGIYRHPSPLSEALEFCHALLDVPRAVLVEPGPRHWSIFAHLCEATDTAGNLVQDAWYAALAIENGCEWISTDRHFSRFPELRWRRPF